MAFEITGHKPGLEGAFVRTQAHTAADALRFAREWAEQGLTGITIVNPKGESYDIRSIFRCDRPRAYRSHYRLVAALDGAGTGRDNLGDIPVRGVHGDISSASTSATDEEPRHTHRRPAMRSRRRTLGHRRPDQRRALHPLGREGSRADPRQRRRRHPRQPRQPQGTGRPPRHPVRRRPSPLPAALQPRPQPDRAALRQAQAPDPQGEPRTIEATWRKVGDLLDLFSPAECANYLKNAGYASV